MLKRILKLPWWLKLALLAVAAAGAWAYWRGGAGASVSATFTVRRGPLEINVLEGGSAEALESQDFKCEVRGYQGVKILKIVEEGYQVTEDDVRTNKVLVELDSSELKKLLIQHEIQLGSTIASVTEARQAYDIQLNQNTSDIKAAEQKARFARMDFEKFMGSKAANEIIAQYGPIDDASPKQETPTAGESPSSTNQFSGASESSQPPPTPQPPPSPAVVEFSRYANMDLLDDGEAKQKLRKFEDEFQVARKSLVQTVTRLEGTHRLYQKGFLSKSEMETDEYILENDKLKLQTAETSRALFLKYEFVKTGEETLSKFVEGMMELGRVRKSAVSKLAQAEAKLKAAEARLDLENKQRDDMNAQIAKCSITARKPGLVVYGGSGNSRYWYGEDQIREGTLVREQQPIITIPNLTQMSVKVRIHETYIQKVKKGQTARITADAFPDRVLLGEITKVGVLPDSQNRWMNPDNKVYLCTVTINDVTDWLKPGMSTKVEVLVNKLADVVYVPIQAVTPIEGKHYCFVGSDRREVEIGEFNDEFIEIKKGLEAGERVALRLPEGVEKDNGTKAKPPAESEKEKTTAAAPVPASGVKL
jgi:multidrug efflux pump subunit AcrA (membrane-fusion protein)